MDRAKFYDALRKSIFRTGLREPQVEGIELIIDEAEARGTLRAHLAYMLATVLHETDRTMQPIEEYGRGKGRKYGVPAGPYHKIYYGRGYVQLTWLDNYELAKQKLGIDFVHYPEKVMEPKWAVAILFSGMEQGWFAGDSRGRHTLDRYINLNQKDYVGARRIINGTDKAAMIAGYAEKFEQALINGDYTRQKITKLAPSVEKAAPPEPPAKNSYASGIIAIISMLAGAGIVLFDRFFQ